MKREETDLKKFQQWDILGDIHGQAGALKRLLRRLGYHRRKGVWQHAERRALFVGDYVNRGPEVAEVVELVRSMTEEGDAVALVGNHDFNFAQAAFLQLADRTAEIPQKVLKQASESLKLYRGERARLRRDVAWIGRLPLVWEDEGFRAVHASWCEECVGVILRKGGPLVRQEDLELTAKGERADAINMLLNGPELILPAGWVPPGRPNRRVRTKWWQAGAASWKAAAYPEEEGLPERPLSRGSGRSFFGYDVEEPPLFFGHYGFPKKASPIRENLACVDFAVARGGSLGAYRWSGERRLTSRHFVLEPG